MKCSDVSLLGNTVSEFFLLVIRADPTRIRRIKIEPVKQARWTLRRPRLRRSRGCERRCKGQGCGRIKFANSRGCDQLDRSEEVPEPRPGPSLFVLNEWLWNLRPRRHMMR